MEDAGFRRAEYCHRCEHFIRNRRPRLVRAMNLEGVSVVRTIIS